MVFVGELSVGEVICVLVVIWRTACGSRLGVRSSKKKIFPSLYLPLEVFTLLTYLTTTQCTPPPPPTPTPD